MSRIKYLLGGGAFGYVFTFEIKDEQIINTRHFSSVFDVIASDLNISGKLEMYMHDGHILSDFEESNPRILRIGVGLHIKGGNNAIQKFKQVCADRLKESITKVAHAAELSEAATVGTIRRSLNPILFAEYKDGSQLSIARMIYD